MKIQGGLHMEDFYLEESKLLKAIADPNRLKILDILSCGEQCACNLLDYFNFTQPTLSHHMKILMECELVNGEKRGTWTHYSLNLSKGNQMIYQLMGIFTQTKECICRQCENKQQESEENSK